MTTPPETRLALADKLAKSEAQSFWHPEIGGDPTIMVNVSLSPSERDLIVAALRATEPAGAGMSVHDFVASYEFRGDGSDHVPSDDERELIEDAIEGYLAQAQASPVIPSQLVAINIKRMTDLIDTAQDDNAWEQEAKAEMQKAVAALATLPTERGEREK